MIREIERCIYSLGQNGMEIVKLKHNFRKGLSER